MNEYLKQYIADNICLDDIRQLYYKLVDSNLFMAIVEQDNYTDDCKDFLPFRTKSCIDTFDYHISMSIDRLQEKIAFNGDEEWPKNFPKLFEMEKYFEDEEFQDLLLKAEASISLIGHVGKCTHKYWVREGPRSYIECKCDCEEKLVKMYEEKYLELKKKRENG